MDVALTRVLFDLGLFTEQQVVDAACDALAGEQDSLSLRLLAGLGPTELGQTRELLDKACEELGVPAEDSLSETLIAARWCAQQVVDGKGDVAAVLSWIAYRTWGAYMESPQFEEDPARRPHEVQRLINLMELADDIHPFSRLHIVAPWMRERLLRDADAIVRAIAGNQELPRITAWDGVEWTGSTYQLRA